MAKFTTHAKERLAQRYGLSENKDIEKVGQLLNNPSKYRVVNKRKYDEVRQIVFGGHVIQAAVNHNHISTVLPVSFAVPETSSLEEQRAFILAMRNKIEEDKSSKRLLIKNLDNMLSKKFCVAFTYFLYYRMKRKEKEEL